MGVYSFISFCFFRYKPENMADAILSTFLQVLFDKRCGGQATYKSLWESGFICLKMLSMMQNMFEGISMYK
jgi:hypothetical protein